MMQRSTTTVVHSIQLTFCVCLYKKKTILKVILKIIINNNLFLEPEWALSQQPMRPKAEWAIDLKKAMRSRGKIITSLALVKLIGTCKIQLVGQKY